MKAPLALLTALLLAPLGAVQALDYAVYAERLNPVMQEMIP